MIIASDDVVSSTAITEPAPAFVVDEHVLFTTGEILSLDAYDARWEARRPGRTIQDGVFVAVPIVANDGSELELSAFVVLSRSRWHVIDDVRARVADGGAELDVRAALVEACRDQLVAAAERYWEAQQ